MLRYRSDLRTLLFLFAYFALLALALSLPATSFPYGGWGMAAMVVLLCLFSFFGAVISHNTIHTPVFHSRTLNRVFQCIVTLTYGHPVSMFVPGHNLSHHKHLQTARDRMRTDKMRFRWNFLNQFLFGWAVGGAIFKDNLEYAKIMRVKNPRWFRQLMVETATYGAFMVGTFAWAYSTESTFLLGFIPLKFLLFVVLPHQYAVWGITGINFVQHDGCDADHPYNHSRNFVGGLVNWFTFNNGYHGIHHMHPGLHWSLTPQAHAQELAPFVDPALDQKSLLVYLLKAYVLPGKRLRFDGREVVLEAPREDQSWISNVVVRSDLADDAELGAVS